MSALRVAPDPSAAAGYLVSPTERYVIVEPLAEGGMGDLYRGQRVGPAGFTKDVAIKLLRRDFARDPRIAALFVQEARLSAALDHPNIVATEDLFRGGDGLCIVMEYVHGADLRVILRKARRRERNLSIASALFIATELLQALAYLHGKCDERGEPLGLLHRDISPANILCGHQGLVKLTDFGIAGLARLRGDEFIVNRRGLSSQSLPKTTGQIEDPSGIGENPLRVRGKVGYMSPEQARGEDIDARSDLFSAAVVLYEILVGERLFIGAAEGATAAQIYSARVTPPSRRRSEVPQALDRVLLKALSLNQEARYPSATALRAALLGVAQEAGLVLSAEALAEDLRVTCGATPEDWRREDERTGTASIGAADMDNDEDPLELSTSGSRSVPRPLLEQSGELPRTLSAHEDGDTVPVERLASASGVVPGAALPLQSNPPPTLGDSAQRSGAPFIDATQRQPSLPQRPPSRLSPTAPLPRSAAEGLGIAALAQRMLPNGTAGEGEADPRADEGGEDLGDDALTRQRPRQPRGEATAAMITPGATAETRQLPLPQLLTQSDAVESLRPAPLSSQRLLFFGAVVALLLGLGFVVGVLLSAPSH